MADYENSTSVLDEDWPNTGLGRGGRGHVWGVTESEGGDPDLVPPTIENLTPAPGALAADGTLAFDVVDTSGTVVGVVLLADYPVARRDELVHNGTAFGRLYTGTRTAIANGWHFEFTRVDGWPRTKAGAPERLRLTIVAFDAAGNAVQV